jgi:hypothetical protein
MLLLHVHNQEQARATVVVAAAAAAAAAAGMSCPCSYKAGLLYAEKGLRSPPNATRRGYRYSRSRQQLVTSLGARANLTRIAQAACGKLGLGRPACVDVMLLSLTPAAYSSNNTLDTPASLALISPAQVRGAPTGQALIRY